jgi:hypothetical protein
MSPNQAKGFIGKEGHGGKREPSNKGLRLFHYVHMQFAHSKALLSLNHKLTDELHHRLFIPLAVTAGAPILVPLVYIRTTLINVFILVTIIPFSLILPGPLYLFMPYL